MNRKTFFLFFTIIFLSFRLQGFVDITLGGDVSVSEGILLDKNFFTASLAQSGESVSNMAFDTSVKLGFNFEMTRVILEDVLWWSTDSYLNGSFSFFVFYDSLLVGYNYFVRYGLNFHTLSLLKISLMSNKFKDTRINIGAGYGLEFYAGSNRIISGVSRMVPAPGLCNYFILSFGLEHFIRFWRIKDINYHRYSLKVKPRFYFGVGLNRTVLQIKFNPATNSFESNDLNYTLSGYPEFKVGFDVTLGLNLNAETFIPGYNIKLSKESSLAFQAKDFSFKELLDSNKKIALSLRNSDIYSSYDKTDQMKDEVEIENFINFYVRDKFTNKTGINVSANKDATDDYNVSLYFNKLRVDKIPGLNVLYYSMIVNVYVFRTDKKGFMGNEKINVCHGQIKPVREVVIPKYYNGSISKLFSEKRENFTILINDVLELLKRDFIDTDK
ncbi:MAG: hypothetical protein KA885_02250 [Spirochaetes bacterium]|nr:hypothetical protein [Spirochaetota bacterium]